MTLKLHNTRTNSLENFVPQNDSEVLLYTCGPTVYSDLTVGNWVAYIAWDTLVRVLRHEGYAVRRVMNITDVGHLTSDEDEGEDKLEKGARRENKTAWQIAELYSEKFLDGMNKLNLLPPEHMARATDFIDEQVALITTLKEKGYTYEIADGIYFDTSKFPNYANFARLNVDAQKAGARVTYNSEKKNASDFALWKFTPAGQKRDMEWELPIHLIENGTVKPGFPGWHLECSAMAMHFLGNTLDIHTGGIDHIPVHHTNEIAQSEAANGQRFSNYWIHNNHLKVDGTKISKSLGNGYTLDDLSKKGFTTMDYRMFVLQSHYQSEGNFTFDNLAAAQNRLKRWKNVAVLRHQIHDTLSSDETKNDDTGVSVLATSGAIVEALRDNLNTPEALKIIDEAFARIEASPLHLVHRFSLIELLKNIDNTLGLQLIDTTPDISDAQKRLLLERIQARANRDWQRSDEIRDALFEDGITLKDTNAKTLWQYM